MKYFLIFAIALVSISASISLVAQTKKPETAKAKPKPTPKKQTTAKASSATPKKTTGSPAAKQVKKDDKADLEKALGKEQPDEKVQALSRFLAEYPKSSLRPRAIESLTAARVTAAEGRFAVGERQVGLDLYKLAAKEAPVPYPERLFNEVISKMPQALYFRGESAAAREIAALIQTNSAASAPQLTALATSFLIMEDGDAAKRIAEEAAKVDATYAPAYIALGMANRLNFDQEAAAAAFAKAMEIDPASVAAKRSLAEAKRSLGKGEDALAIYDELIAKDAEDVSAKSGRILSLFDIGKKTEAETELAKSIEADPNNVSLIGSAAYWYAANGEAARAIDLAGKALSADPRFIWSHIALARAMLSQGRFSDAEQTLLKARQYGNFPTLQYEIASTKLAGGFYREAAEELAKSFAVRDGKVTTKLGRRVERTEASFTDLLAGERKASILQPKAADDTRNAETLRALLEFHAYLSSPAPEASKAGELADAFSRGADKMRFHRQVYAAAELADRKLAPAKVLELSKAAVSSVEDGLSIEMLAAPIMATELYPARAAAVSADRYVLVPEVAKATLTSIARGRIEELAATAFLQQSDLANAITRYRRAVSVLPEKSIWWRNSYWGLGEALKGSGNDKEALDAYVKSYTSGEPDAVRYGAIEALYTKINSSTEGLEKLIGAKPEAVAAKTEAAGPPASNSAETVEKPVAEATPTPNNAEATTTEPPAVEPQKSSEPKKDLFDPVVIEVKSTGSQPPPTSPKQDLGRPRLIEGKEVRTGSECGLSISQESVSLIAGAGSIGILVNYDGSMEDVKVSSSNTKEIEVAADSSPAIGKHRLFVIRSVGSSPGLFDITFAAPCGAKNVAVKVR